MTNLRRECGQASIVVLWILIGAVALAVVLVGLARIMIASARLDGAATLASQALASGDVGWQRIATDNGARTVAIEGDGGKRYVVASARITTLGIAINVEGRSPNLSAHRELTGGSGAGSVGSTSEYRGPLVQVDLARVCPRVATAYLAMQRAAALNGVHFTATSGYRTYAEQAALFAQLGPQLAAPPGTSLHHAATELDIAVGPAGSPAHAWLTAHAPSYGFIQRYAWEPWHWGNVRGC